ncbi:MAG: Gar1/Naf1 family protein [Methanobacteriaceae archaeon]|nr:Gar1/Naf1 family protein [Methanobacteriaceae archaeon]
MKELGIISHISNKGNIILRSNQTPGFRLPVFTKKKEKLGIVHDIFGPTKNPYITIKPNRAINSKNFENRVGEVLYIGTKPVKKWGRRKRRKK